MYKKAVVFVFLLTMTCAMAVGCRAMEETLDREENKMEESTTIDMQQNNEQGEDYLGDDPTNDDMTTEQNTLKNNK